MLLRFAFLALLVLGVHPQTDPTTTIASTTTATPLATTTTLTPTIAPTTTTAVVPTTTASTVPTTTKSTVTTLRPVTTTTSSTITPKSTTPDTTETPETETPAPTSPANTGNRGVFKGFAGFDDWIWWTIIGGGAFLILILIVCICICVRRGKAKAHEEALQAMEEQRDAENHSRMLADAQKQRRERELQQRSSVGVPSNDESSPPKRPSYYRRPSQGRASYLANPSGRHTVNTVDRETPYISVQSPTSAGHHNNAYVPPSSVNERIEALKTRNSVQKDSYTSEPGYGYLAPGIAAGFHDNGRDTTLTGYSMDIDGDYESTVGGTFLSPMTKDSLYKELDTAKLDSPTRAAMIKSGDSRRSDGSDIELDVDSGDATRGRIPSHRSIEF